MRKKRKYRKRKNAEKEKDEEIKIEIEIKNENDSNNDKLDDGIKEIVCEIEPNNPKNSDIKVVGKQQNNNTAFLKAKFALILTSPITAAALASLPPYQ